MNVLVTGFGPFPGVPENVSSTVAAYCASTWSARPGVNAETLALATDWHTAPAIVAEQIDMQAHDVILHLGVSEQAQHLVLETHAYNACSAMPDVDGQIAPAERLTVDGPESFQSTAPIEAIAAHLTAAGHNVTMSDDPGRYLCNAVYHETLSRIANTGHKCQAIFIHMPTVLNDNTIPFETVIAGLDIVLDTLIEG